jgi:hypothetical protein
MGGRRIGGVRWLELIVLVVFAVMVGTVIYMWPAPRPNAGPQSESIPVVVSASQGQAGAKGDQSGAAALRRIEQQEAELIAARTDLRNTRTYVRQMANVVRGQSARQGQFENQLGLLTGALLLLAVLSLGSLIWLARRVERALADVQSRASTERMELQTQSATRAELATRLAQVETSLKEMLDRESAAKAAAAQAAREPLSPSPVPSPVTPTTPAASVPPDHRHEVRKAGKKMRTLLNEQSVSAEEYEGIIDRFPERWVITVRGLEPFSKDNQRDHEIILFGYADAMVALPAQWAVQNLSGSYADPSRADRWFHEWFNITAISGKPFEIIDPAEATIRDGRPQMTLRGAMNLRG